MSKKPRPPGAATLPFPTLAESAFQQAAAQHRHGRLAEAERLYEQVLRDDPQHFDALHLLGVVALQTGRTQRGVELVQKAISLNGGVASAYNNLGNGLRDLRRFDEALARYDKAIALKPDCAEAYNNRGTAQKELGRLEEALASHDRAIALAPWFAEAHNNRGAALYNMRRFDEALAAFDKAIALRADFAAAHSNRGMALQQLQRRAEALASYHTALALKRDYAEVYSNCGALLRDMGRLAEALGSCDRAVALKPGLALAHCYRAQTLSDLQRFEEAAASCDAALALDPDLPYLAGMRLFTKMRIGDWRDLDAEAAAVVAKVQKGERASPPFALMGICGAPEIHAKAARILAQDKHPFDPALGRAPACKSNPKIRIGYFSADLYDHATARLAAELFERHDRAKFEIIAMSYGPITQDPMQLRLQAAFDRFIDVQKLSDREIAALARSLEIDIAVDLKGFTQEARTGVFACRAAPIQVNYLGYPGAMAADYIDYLIADPTLIPPAQQQLYQEKIVYLPACYQPNDSKRAIAPETPSRAQAGLPEQGFVFCCFNNSWKITPDIFDCWMRILRQTNGAVLWLLEDNPAFARNMRREAARRCVAGERLVFAPRVALPDHLARHRLADLFLDTSPYNAHTTASDALWAGLPLVTFLGESFPGRVAASLLNAVDLPELIAPTPPAYEALALDLAASPDKLAGLKRKLLDRRRTAPLFDAARLAADLEAAYRQMQRRREAGLPPDHIVLPQRASLG